MSEPSKAPRSAARSFRIAEILALAAFSPALVGESARRIYSDRPNPIDFPAGGAPAWKFLYRQVDGAPVPRRTEIAFPPVLAGGLSLEPGEMRTIAIPAGRWPIGLENDLGIQAGGEEHLLHLFRYDPLERTLALFEGILGRLGRKGLYVAAERGEIEPPSWGAVPFSSEKVVQPVLDARCASCHQRGHESGIDLTGALDRDRVPASHRSLIARGLLHHVDCGWNSAGCEKREPLTFGTVKSKLWKVLDAGHHDVSLTREEKLRLKRWIDLNCPLRPDSVERGRRPGSGVAQAPGVTQAE